MGIPRVGKLSTDIETTFGTNQVETYRDQRIREPPKITNVVQRLPNMTLSDRINRWEGFKDASQFGTAASLQLYLDGLAAALDTSATYTHPQNNIAELLDAMLGGNSGGAGSTVSGGAATTTSIPVQAGHGTRFSKGGAVVIGGEMREIKNVSTDTLTLKMALSGAPIDTTPVYNCATFFYDEDDVGGSGSSFMMRYLGLQSTDQWLLRGGCGTFTLSPAIDSFLGMDIDARFASWEKTTGETLADPSFTGGGPLTCKAGFLWWQTVGVTTRNIMSCGEFSVDPKMSVVTERALNGVQTSFRHRATRMEPIASFEAYSYENLDEFYTDFATEATKKAFLLQLGNAPIVGGVGTGIVGISLPNCQYSEAPSVDRTGDLNRVHVAVKALEDEDITSPTSGTSAAADLHRSAMRIHLA